MSNSQDPRLVAFENAFRVGGAGACRECVCGKVFFDRDGDWDWEDGEQENLQNKENCFAMPYAIGGVLVDGLEYADACDCWHASALRICHWLEENAARVAEYFKEESQRKRAQAERLGAAAEAIGERPEHTESTNDGL